MKKSYIITHNYFDDKNSDESNFKIKLMMFKGKRTNFSDL